MRRDAAGPAGAPVMNPTPQPRAALVALLSEGFLSRLSSGIVGFALPLYALELGLGIAEISVLVTLNLLVGMALKPFAGRLVDRFGSGISSTLALAARSGLYLLLGLAGGAVSLFVIQATRGVTKAVRDPALYALLAVLGGRKRVAGTFGWYQAAKGSAGSFGHGLGGFLLAITAGSFGWAFAVAAAIAFVPCVLLPLLIRPAHGTAPARPNDPPPVESPRGRQPAWRQLLPFIGFGFLVSATSRMLSRMMPLLLVEYAGLAASEAGALYVIAGLVPLVAAPVFGWVYDRLSPGLVLQTRSVLNAVSSLLYIVSPTWGGFATGKLLDKGGTSAFGPAWGALMARASSEDPARRASRIALMSAGQDAGNVGGPILAGLLWSVFGPVPMLAARLAFSLAAGAYTVFLLRWMKRRLRRQPASPAPPGPRQGPPGQTRMNTSD